MTEIYNCHPDNKRSGAKKCVRLMCRISWLKNLVGILFKKGLNISTIVHLMTLHFYQRLINDWLFLLCLFLPLFLCVETLRVIDQEELITSTISQFKVGGFVLII